MDDALLGLALPPREMVERAKAFQASRPDICAPVTFVKDLAAEFTSVRSQAIEMCAGVADAFADENLTMAGDTILLDPVLRHEGFTAENMERSEDLQVKGTVHSAMFHAAQEVAASIRSLR